MYGAHAAAGTTQAVVGKDAIFALALAMPFAARLDHVFTSLLLAPMKSSLATITCAVFVGA